MPVKKKQNVNDLKTELLNQIKQDEKYEKLDLEWYTEILPHLEQCRRECVADIRQENEKFKKNKRKRKSILCYNDNDVQNTANIEQICIENLLLIVQYLKQSSSGEKCDTFDQELEDCIRRQNSNYPTYWDSSSNILLALKQCVLTRDWQKMSRFLLILLNYGKKYLPIVRNYCRIMLQYWPAIKQSGLEADFIVLTGNQSMIV